MAAATRDFAITYGSLTIGRGSSPDMPITGQIATTENHDIFSATFSFLVLGTGPSDFEGNLASARSAFRKPNQNLTITVGDTQTRDTWYTFNHASGTGFNSTSEITKDEEEGNSGICQRLSVSIEVQLPADLLGTANGQLGRRSTTVVTDKAPSGRRTLTIDGVYTATTTNTTGLAQYEASIGAYATAVQTALDSTAAWELVEEFTDIADTAESSVSPATHFGKGKVCTFRRVFEELLFRQGDSATASSPNDAEILKQRFRVQSQKYNRENIGDLRSPAGTDRAVINYTCEIDTSQTGTNLATTYDTKIRQFILDETINMTSLVAPTIFREDVEYNVDTNEISATWEIGGAIGGPGVVAEVDIQDSVPDTGEVLVPVHAGDQYAYFSFKGAAVRTRSIRIVEHVTRMDTENPLPRGSYTHPPNGRIKSTAVQWLPMQIRRHFQDYNSQIRYSISTKVTTVEIQYFSDPSHIDGEIGQDVNALPGLP